MTWVFLIIGGFIEKTPAHLLSYYKALISKFAEGQREVEVTHN